MKSFKILLIFIIIICLFASCKKDYEGPQGPTGPSGPTGNFNVVNPELYNKWEVVSGLDKTKYMIIKNDNVVFTLDSTVYGFKSFDKYLAFVTYNQLTSGETTYNYSISNDTLRLTNMNTNIILKKNINAPVETQWVTFVNVTDSIDSPAPNEDGREDIGFDGTNILWTAESNSSTLYKINPVTHTVTTLTLSASYYYGSVNYANSFIWISNDSYINKVNPATGAIVSSSPVISSATISSLALIGQLMYFGNVSWYNSNWDIVSNTVTPLFNYGIKGMEYVNGFLYIISGKFIYKCDITPSFHIISTYYIDYSSLRGNIGGITHDGTNFWITGKNQGTNIYRLLKLNL